MCAEAADAPLMRALQSSLGVRAFVVQETNLTARHIPNIGSAVAFFQQTYRAKKLLVAWAEAMAYGPNKRAPDDQVLDMLLLKGDWIKRASFGWLPSSYLRMMPAYYRGVDPVIDHDHGNRPGLLKHSEAKPQMPPVRAPIPSPRCAPLPCSLDCLLTADLLLR
jgi:hypothetical protein